MSAPPAARSHLLPALLAATALCLMAVLSSCAKDSASPKEETQPSSAAAQATPPTISAPPAVAVDLAELTQVVRKFAAEKRRVPKSLEEVVAAGYLPSLPAAPAGKKFGIDKNLQVYLADR